MARTLLGTGKLGHSDAIKPKRRQHRPEWFRDLGRLILEVLRDAPEPIPSREIAAACVERGGLRASDRQTLAVVERPVPASLNRREGRLVERVEFGPRRVRWRVAG